MIKIPRFGFHRYIVGGRWGWQDGGREGGRERERGRKQKKMV